MKAPFPYFGGKGRAAATVWQALGDPAGYVEPFAGSAAVLLARPEFKGRRTETLNDADGWLVNAWRAIQLDPAGVAAHAWGPVSEIDYHARLAWLQERRTPDLVAWLEGAPENHDAKAAAWWLYVLACGIGDPFGGGPWKVLEGHLRNTSATPGRASTGVNRELPHLGDAGQGIHRALPHLGDAGQGIHRALPHLGDAGKGDLDGYLQALAARLAKVRITCGDWRRVVTPSVHRAGSGGDGSRAIFLDPPYATSGDLYAHTDGHESVAADVAAWCASGDAAGLRIVLCGYDDEHAALEAIGWEVVDGKSGGGAGYSTRRDNGRRERLWLSPECNSLAQPDLFGGAA